jgi:hypothetical protein
VSVVPAADGDGLDVAGWGWIPSCEGCGEDEGVMECEGCGDRLCPDCWGDGERFCDDCLGEGEGEGARPVETVDVGERYL